MTILRRSITGDFEDQQEASLSVTEWLRGRVVGDEVREIRGEQLAWNFVSHYKVFNFSWEQVWKTLEVFEQNCSKCFNEISLASGLNIDYID